MRQDVKDTQETRLLTAAWFMSHNRVMRHNMVDEPLTKVGGANKAVVYSTRDMLLCCNLHLLVNLRCRFEVLGMDSVGIKFV
jgi:hypothetical protein